MNEVTGEQPLHSHHHGSYWEFTGQQIHRDPSIVSKVCPGVSTQKDTPETRPQGDVQISAQSSHKLSSFTIISFLFKAYD